jgi:membrane-associated protease RseP (regulator of RpoE activity)
MRLWPRRAISAAGEPGAEDLLVTEEMLRRSAEDVLLVSERHIRGGVIVFRGALRTAPAGAVETLTRRFRPFGYTPFLRRDGDSVVVQAWPAADVVERPRFVLSLVLFLLTCLSTLFAGAIHAGVVDFSTPPMWLLSGAPFAATLIAILGVHEFGHYFTARHYKAAVSLPYFIPAPPPLFLFGTMGAIIRMRSPVRDRNSLFDIAAAGPLAGLVVAIPAMILGLAWSTLQPLPTGPFLQTGDSLLTIALTALRFGSVPAGMIVYTHPVADAAWVGLFVTALNLFPVGQLDGGRIAYALFGRRHRAVGFAAFAATLVLGVLTWSLNWFVWGALIFFLVGFHHSPPVDDITPLSPARRMIAIASLVLFAVLLPPVPIYFGG